MNNPVSPRTDRYAMQCPINVLDCPHFYTAADAIDHVVAVHDPRLVATMLAREVYINRRTSDIIESLGRDVEEEIEAIIPDPVYADTMIEIQFGE